MKKIILACVLTTYCIVSLFSCRENEKKYQLVKISGDHQIASRWEFLPKPIKVKLLDENGVGVRNAKLDLRVFMGRGYVEEKVIITNNRGEAEGAWAVGLFGDQKLQVGSNRVDGIYVPAIFFEATLDGGAINTLKDSFIDARDGEVYKTVKLGSQTWMSENLRYNASNSQMNSNNPSNKYGRLYNWQLTDGICPDGWHLPTDSEWTTLENLIGGTNSVGSELKSTTGWDNLNGSDSYGFNALPAGYYASGAFLSLSKSALFWTDNQNDTLAEAWSRTLYSSNSTIGRYSKVFNYYLSCRCVKNE